MVCNVRARAVKEPGPVKELVVSRSSLGPGGVAELMRSTVGSSIATATVTDHCGLGFD